ncbi:MAG: hypothetical protein ABJN36_07845 [Cyclobacteriaceae bacterium]
MAGGIGFVRDAQASFERNRSMRGGKGPFKRAEDNKYIGKKHQKKTPKYNEMSEAELAAFSAHLRSQSKKRLVFEIVGGIILTVLFFASLWWLFF